MSKSGGPFPLLTIRSVEPLGSETDCTSSGRAHRDVYWPVLGIAHAASSTTGSSASIRLDDAVIGVALASRRDGAGSAWLPINGKNGQRHLPVVAHLVRHVAIERHGVPGFDRD